VVSKATYPVRTQCIVTQIYQRSASWVNVLELEETQMAEDVNVYEVIVVLGLYECAPMAVSYSVRCQMAGWWMKIICKEAVVAWCKASSRYFTTGSEGKHETPQSRQSVPRLEWNRVPRESSLWRPIRGAWSISSCSEKSFWKAVASILFFLRWVEIE
jgi:hypothetical protein